MAIVNLIAILLLGKWAFALLADFEAARAAKRDPVLHVEGNERLPGELVDSAWSQSGQP